MNEPVRRSYLDVVKRNLRAANRHTFCTRLIFFGEYRDSAENFQKQVESLINQQNAEFNEIPIHGLLVIYENYFIHLITAPEEMIFRHLKVLLDDKAGEIKLGKVSHFPVHHHVYQPYFTSWYSIITKPPIFLDKLENTGLPGIEKHTKNVMMKIYRLCEFLMDTHLRTGDSIARILENIGGKVPELLPEIPILDFFLNANSLIYSDLRILLKNFMEIPYINLYHERVWPPPSNFMPDNKFLKLQPSISEKKKNEEESNF